MSELIISWPFIEKVLISLAIGALMGMEREHTKHQEMVGIRTFALVSLLGALFVFFAEATGSELQVFLGFGAITMFTVIMYAGNLFKFKAVGLTTSIALLLAYGMGTLVAYGMYSQAIFVTIAITIVLFAKQRLHTFVDKVGDKELLDFLEFLAIVGIVYPILPAGTIPFMGIQVDLFAIWLLVVLISVINLFGFIGSRYFSAEKEVGLMALLGGLVSTTAMTLTLPGTLKKRGRELLPAAYLVTSGSTLARNLIIAAIFAPLTARYLVFPIAAAAAIVIGLGFHGLSKAKNIGRIKVESPFKVPKAVELALKLFVIMIAVEMIQAYLPEMFYVTVFFGGIISSASTVATVALLAGAGKISATTAAMGISTAILGAFAFGHLATLHIAGGKHAVRKLLPVVVCVSAVYVAVLAAMMAVI